MKEYKVVSSAQVENLSKKVSSFLNEGWECVGGVVVSASSFYFQTLVRDIKEHRIENSGIDLDYCKECLDLNVPTEVSKTEAIIYDWVYENYGESEVQLPAYDLTKLAKYINDNINTDYKQQHAVAYRDEIIEEE